MKNYERASKWWLDHMNNRETISQDSRNTFAAVLHTYIQNQLKMLRYCSLGTGAYDVSIDHVLKQAARKAEIPLSAFPRDIFMWITPSIVDVKVKDSLDPNYIIKTIYEIQIHPDIRKPDLSERYIDFVLPATENYIASQTTPEAIKYKNLLKKFLKDDSILSEDIRCEIDRYGRCELFYNKKIYSVAELNRVSYGDAWFNENVYEDINGYRISYHTYIACNKLIVAGKDVYAFRHRPDRYADGKTEKQLTNLAANWCKEIIAAHEKYNIAMDFDINDIEKMIKAHLSKLYKQLWWQKKGKRNGRSAA